MSTTEVATEIQTELIAVTPALAQIWLGRNTQNRRLKSDQVLAWTKEMTEGRWQVNGESIKLAGPLYAPTRLLDGQNRLHAIIRAGIPVTTFVVYNLPAHAQLTMDSGTKRSAADNLTISGMKNSMTVAAAAAMSIRFSDGRLSGNGLAVANSRVAEWIEEHPEIEISAAIAGTFAVKADATKSLVAYTHWRFAQLDMDAATTFWRDAAEKVGLMPGDPVLALTNRFATARRNRERFSSGAGVAATFRAWNARRQAQPLRTLSLNAPTESFPRIK